MLENENKRLIDMQEEQLKVNKATLAWLQKQDEKEDSDSVQALAQMMLNRANLGVQDVGLPTSQALIPIEIGTKVTQSPKLDFAIEYLNKNPHERLKSGRELESSVFMNGETISYKWWNKAKNI